MASHLTAFVVGVPSLQLDRLAVPLFASAALTPSSQICHGCRTKAIPDGDMQRSAGMAVSSIVLRGGLGALAAISWRRWSTGRHHLTTACRATLRKKRRFERDDFDEKEILSAEDAFNVPSAKKKKSGKQTQGKSAARALNDNDVRASKAKLKEICSEFATGRALSEEQNAEIETIVMSFELTPSAKSPAKSPLADGEWNVVYTTGKGDGMGMAAGEIKQTVDGLAQKLTDIVSTGLGSLCRVSDWFVMSKDTWRLTRRGGWSPMVFGLPFGAITFDEEALEMSVSVQVIYLDKNFRIWRMEGMQEGKFTTRYAVFERI